MHKTRLYLVSVFVAAGIALSGTLKATAASDAEQIAQTLVNIDRANLSLNADLYMKNLDLHYVQSRKNSPAIHFAEAQQNIRKNFQMTRRYLNSSNKIDKLQVRDERAIALVTETNIKEVWYDNSHTIFYTRKYTGTEKQVFNRTPNGWKLLSAEALKWQAQNGDPQSVKGKLSKQQVAVLKAKSDIWRVYAHNYVNQILIDQMMRNMR
jgi:hypothetical protein